MRKQGVPEIDYWRLLKEILEKNSFLIANLIGAFVIKIVVKKLFGDELISSIINFIADADIVFVFAYFCFATSYSMVKRIGKFS